jgi:hypothetical protein
MSFLSVASPSIARLVIVTAEAVARIDRCTQEGTLREQDQLTET